MIFFAVRQTDSAAPIKIAIAGDSTVQDYPLDHPNKQPGWGQLLPLYVDEKRIKITNFAAGGRSTKTFKLENVRLLLARHGDARTHFTEAGAKLIAGFVAQETVRVVPELRSIFRPPA